MMREFGKFFIQAKRISNEVKGHFETIMNEAEMNLLEEEKKKAKVPLSPPLNPPHSEPHGSEKHEPKEAASPEPT